MGKESNQGDKEKKETVTAACNQALRSLCICIFPPAARLQLWTSSQISFTRHLTFQGTLQADVSARSSSGNWRIMNRTIMRRKEGTNQWALSLTLKQTHINHGHWKKVSVIKLPKTTDVTTSVSHLCSHVSITCAA